MTLYREWCLRSFSWSSGSRWKFALMASRPGTLSTGMTPWKFAIIDWMMPGMHGIEICQKVREGRMATNPYLMLLTVKGDKEDKIRGLQAGADDYLTNPFNSEELRVRIRVGQRIVRLQRQRIEFETRFYVRQLEEMVEELL